MKRTTYQRPARRYRPPVTLTAAAYVVASSGIVAAAYALAVALARLTG